MEFNHIPVMKEEVIKYLNVKNDGVYVDCTLGGGGHSYEILSHLSSGELYAFDRDMNAIETCQKKFKGENNITIIKDNFHNAKKRLESFGITEVDGILIDLGVSSPQIDQAERGFSFLHNGKLDMRMDQSQNFSAYDVVNSYSETDLIRIFREYGEEEFAKSIARNIVKRRLESPIVTTFELRDIIEKSMPTKIVYARKGASKKVFQAIRIEVNGELDQLKETLCDLISMLKSGGRLVVLTFHSLEDRIVKQVFKDKTTDCICPPKTPKCICGHRAEGILITKKAITATESELQINPRAKSAKLRVFEKK